MPTSQSAYSAANEIAAGKIDKPSSASAGQVLSYNGSTWVAAASGSSVTSGTAVTLTSQTSVDFTGIPSTAKKITVMFSGMSTSGTSIPQIQLGTSSGVETTSYIAGAANIGATTAATTATSGLILSQATGAANTFYGNVIITLLSGSAWTSTGMFAFGDGSGIRTCAGGKTLAGTLDRIRLTTVNGTDLLDAGTVNIMWE